MSRAPLVCALLSIFIINTECARILAIFSVPSISHSVVFRPIYKELANRGHELVVVTTDPAFPKNETPANLKEIDVHDMSYKLWREYWATVGLGNANDIISQLDMCLELAWMLFYKQVKHDEVQKIINNKEEFDLLIIETGVKAALGLSHIFKVPVVSVSSLGPIWDSNSIAGAPIHPVLYPAMFNQKQNDLTVWDKIKEIYTFWRLSNAIQARDVENDILFKNLFGPDMPSITELQKNIDLFLVNVHPIWDTNRPVPPNVIHMGGLHQKPPKELPKDLEAYLNSSKHGVIYFSFGTNTNPATLPPENIQLFVKVFSQLPYDVLWKWDEGELPGRTDNIKIFKWLPQSDLLRHPKIKLFITQGGLQSTDEAITAGVPLIGIPMLGDQWYNVEKYVLHKIGVRLDFDKLTEESLKGAIENVINDGSYRRNIEKLRSLIQDQPQQPLERAIWWIEYLLRHGGAKHLRSPGANMSWQEYYQMDVVLTVLGALGALMLTVVVILIYLWKFVCSKMCKNQKPKPKKS